MIIGIHRPLAKCDIQYILKSNHPLKKFLTPQEIAFAREYKEDLKGKGKLKDD